MKKIKRIMVVLMMSVLLMGCNKEEFESIDTFTPIVFVVESSSSYNVSIPINIGNPPYTTYENQIGENEYSIQKRNGRTITIENNEEHIIIVNIKVLDDVYTYEIGVGSYITMNL